MNDETALAETAAEETAAEPDASRSHERWKGATGDMALYGATTDQPAAPAARIVTEKLMSRIIPLEWPVEFDGKVYYQIRVHRVTGKEMRDFLDVLRSGTGGAMPPMVDCPVEVWEALDADDQQTIDEAAGEFMPKRLKLLQQTVAALDAAGN